MAKVKQLTVSLENRPGTLAQMAKVLADAKVNVTALLNSTSGAQGSAQVVVGNVNKAKKALGAAGLSYTEGTLEQIPEKLPLRLLLRITSPVDLRTLFVVALDQTFFRHDLQQL